MSEPITLPLKPEPLEGEAPAAFDARMLNWWRECDVLLRVNCQEMKQAWMEGVVPQFTPTLERIADAWGAMDVRLGELASALSGQAPATATGDAARVAMAALMTEGGADKPPAEVAQAVLARVAAVDTMLGGEAPAP